MTKKAFRHTQVHVLVHLRVSKTKCAVQACMVKCLRLNLANAVDL